MSDYRIFENKGYFYVTFKDRGIGRLYETTEEAIYFIEEHKKAREYNIERIKEQTK